MGASGNCGCRFKNIGGTLEYSGVINTLECGGFGIILGSVPNPDDGDIIGDHTGVLCLVNIIAGNRVNFLGCKYFRLGSMRRLTERVD